MALIVTAAIAFLGASDPPARHFYPDDPLWKSPPPTAVKDPLRREIDALYDFVANSFNKIGERHPPGSFIPSKDVNTLGEVPDSEWYTNRHYWHPMSIEELKRGPVRGNEPVAPFQVVDSKSEGITIGFQMKDAKGRRYLCKPDPIGQQDLASAADVIGSKFFYAFGYNVPENYIAYFKPGEISVAETAKITPMGGKERRMVVSDFDRILDQMPRDREGRYRVIASMFVAGKPLGPFRMHGIRTDDPNDIHPHEHRRVLRGLYVFEAFVNNTDAKAGNSLDTLVEVDGRSFIRHHLIDFSSAFGSDSDDEKNARFGHEYMIDASKRPLGRMAALGLYVTDWERMKKPGIPAVGRWDSETFHPDKWVPNYPNPAFNNRLPDDTFWSAKQVMAFTDEQIRAIVETGQYRDQRAVDYNTKILIERRNKIGREFFAKVLPLDRFDVRGGKLEFVDLAVKHGFAKARVYQVRWHQFQNGQGRRSPIGGAQGFNVPSHGASEFVLAEIRAPGEDSKSIWVYLRGDKVVGLDRTW